MGKRRCCKLKIGYKLLHKQHILITFAFKYALYTPFYINNFHCLRLFDLYWLYVADISAGGCGIVFWQDQRR